jgi:hypothetical protein
MFSAAFCFLGIAGFIVVALACVVKAVKPDHRVEVDIGGLHAAAACMWAGTDDDGNSSATESRELSAHEKAKWREVKKTWMEWYAQCVEQVNLKQKTLYSWARTLALCAALSLIGVVLEVKFGAPISLSNILAGLRRSQPAASASQSPHSTPHRGPRSSAMKSVGAGHRLP